MSVAIAPAPVAASPPRTRLGFIDNLRWFVIVLVVSMHAAVTYSHIGSWYYMEGSQPNQAVTAVFAIYQVFLQAFFMGLLFLIAGYFVPGAFDRKGFGRFVRDRAVRLGIPAILFMLFIQPLVVFWLLRDFHDHSRPSLARAYWPYLRHGDFLSGSGPMWFTLALVIFSVAYGLAQLATRDAPQNRPDAPLPGSGQIAALALVIALCTFLVRIVQPIGTSILNMQLCFFSQYVILFAVGVQARRKNWLLRFPYAMGIRWLAWAVIVGIVALMALVKAVVATHSESSIVGGFTWQSAALCVWESFVCVGICLGLLVLFREKFNEQGRVGKWLGDNSFAVYMFHTPILVAVTLLLTHFAAPRLVKFVCATLLGVAATYLASSLVLRRIPLLRRVL